jgi:hypothetical protein
VKDGLEFVCKFQSGSVITAIGKLLRYSIIGQTPEGITLTAHVDAASSQALYGTDRVYFMRVADSKLIMKSPGVIVPMTGTTSVVEIELEKSD